MSSSEEAEKKITYLRREVERYNELYHRRAQQGLQPEISDHEYDRLKRELSDLEAEFPDLRRIDSPTQRVGDDRLEGFTAHAHRQPMLSLDNTYNKDELYDFDRRLKKMLEIELIDFVVEPKIDGVAVSLTYTDGRLVRALTRGNGTEGDDVTVNVNRISSLPQELVGSNPPTLIEIRGEVYMTLKEFERINTERAKKGLPLYANPRNFAAGTIKLLDPQVAAQRKLEIVLYGLGFCDPPTFTHQSKYHEQLNEWNLPTVEKYWRVRGIEEAWEHIVELDTLRGEFSYATDGAVIKVDEFVRQVSAGSTAKAPRWAISYKFAAEQTETQLKRISIQVGRTGILTPVAELEPVKLAGTTVSRATLHNADEIARKDIREKDTVVVEKAGEIIPAVVRVIPEKRPPNCAPFDFAQRLLDLGISGKRVPGEVAWRLVSEDDPSMIRRRIQHFASRQAMDIEGLGVAVVDQLVTRELIHDVSDLYELKVKDLIDLEKFAQRSADNLIHAIEASKEADLWRLLHGLGIPHVGATSAKDLAGHFESLHALTQATEDNLLEVDGVGEIMAACICQFFEEQSNRRIIEQLANFGLKTERETSIKTSSTSLADLTFVITGTLPSMTREEAKALIEGAGGKVTGSVSKKTNYLLAGESAGSKYVKAEKLGITIIGESELRRLLQ